MKNICRYIAVVMAFVMTLMMTACGSDTNSANKDVSSVASKSSSSAVNSEAVLSVAVSSEAVSSVAASSESVSSVAASSKATSSGAWSSGKVTHGNSAGDVVMSPTYESSSRTVSSWVCPEPGTHVNECYNQKSHDSYVESAKELAEHEKWLNETVLPSIPEGYTLDTWCIKCNRPSGDGYNGTCYRYLCHQGVNGSSCHHYDEDDGTCKEKHWGYAEKFGHE